jgi:hypothetical protein
LSVRLAEANAALLLLEPPQEGSDRVLNHLGRLNDGDPHDYRAPFLNDLERGEVVDLVEEEVFANEASWPPGLREIEDEEAGKIGPLSPTLPFGEWKTNVEEYFLRHPTSHVSSRAYRSVLDLFRGIKLQAHTARLAFDAMPRDTNLGLPWFSRQKKYAASYLHRANEIESGGFREAVFPAVLALRKQQDGSQWGKHRPVWAMDHVETIHAIRVQTPFLEFARFLSEFAAWNELSEVDRVITGILQQAGSSPTLGIDFSGYDRRMPASLIRQSFDILRDLFPSARHLVDWLEMNFIEVDLLTPHGLLDGKDGGVPSGSGLTNLVDSLCQLLLFFEVCDRLKVKPGPRTIMGDDGVWTFRPVPDLDEIASVLDDYGMEANPAKQSFEVGVVRFLQRYHTLKWMPDGLARGIRPITRTFGSMISFERSPDPSVWTPDMHLLREVSQLENNKWHPSFASAVNFLREHDKLLLRGRSISSAIQSVGGTSALKAALRRPSFPFGVEDESGLASFEVVKLLEAVP